MQGGIVNPGSACYLISALRCLWSHFQQVKAEKQYNEIYDTSNIDKFYNLCSDTIGNKHDISFFLSKMKKLDPALFGEFSVAVSDDSRMFYRCLIKYIVSIAPRLGDLYYFKHNISCSCFGLSSGVLIESVFVPQYDDMFGILPIILGRQLQCKKCKRRYCLNNIPKYFMVYCDRQPAVVNRNMEIRTQDTNPYNYSNKCYTRKCTTISISTGGTGHSYAYVQGREGSWVKYDDSNVTEGIKGNIQDNIMFFVIGILNNKTNEWPDFDEFSMFEHYNNNIEKRDKDKKRLHTATSFKHDSNSPSNINIDKMEVLNKSIESLQSVIINIMDENSNIIREQSSKIKQMEQSIHDRDKTIKEIGDKLTQQLKIFTKYEPYIKDIDVLIEIIDSEPHVRDKLSKMLAKVRELQTMSDK